MNVLNGYVSFIQVVTDISTMTVTVGFVIVITIYNDCFGKKLILIKFDILTLKFDISLIANEFKVDNGIIHNTENEIKKKVKLIHCQLNTYPTAEQNTAQTCCKIVQFLYFL